MRNFRFSIIVCSLLLSAFAMRTADAGCRTVGPVDSVKISPQDILALNALGFDRSAVFDALKVTAQFETSGCWGGATGDFDDQIVSVGALQFNFGKGSLQKVLVKYKNNMGPKFVSELKQLMPQYGAIVFSDACLSTSPSSKNACRKMIYGDKTEQDLPSSWKEEFDNLFNTDEMIQIQVDRFVALIESVKDDVTRLFGAGNSTARRVLWTIDSKVQVTHPFPSDSLVKRVRSKWSGLKPDEKRTSLLALVDWYQGLALSVDQDGARKNVDYNSKHWREAIQSNAVDAEQAELLNFTFVVSRIVNGKDGLYQADTFQRRAKIALGIGKVH
jgi:hypothetical protein